MNIRLILLALSCLFFSTLSHAEYKKLDAIIAIVDDDIITESDLQEKIQMVRGNLLQQQITVPEAEIRKQVMDRLILESLQLQMAQRAGITISDEQLNRTMTSIAQRNGLDLAGFHQELEQQGIDYQVMREQIRDEMIIQQVQQGNLQSRIQITEQDVANFLNSAEGKQITATQYHLQHILLPVDESASTQETENAHNALLSIRQQLTQGQVKFEQLIQQQSLGQISLGGADFGWQRVEDLPSLFADKAITMTAGDISQPIRSGAGWHLLRLADKTGGNDIVNQVHARHILIMPSEVRSDEQAQALATKLYEDILQGGDFNLLAKEYSEDKGSALQGGDLGWSGPGQYLPEFEQTLHTLAVEEISRPIKTSFGWHIIQKLGERQQNMTKEHWKNQARQAIYERKFADELDAWLARIRDEAFIEIK